MIKIKKLTMENFGVFKKKQSIEFSTDEQKPLTVIIGKNGGGKTTLVNAINWCFYKFEPHGKKDANYSAPILNSTYLLEVGEEKTARTSVKVLLQVGDEQYSISRVLTVLVHKIEYEKLSDGVSENVLLEFETMGDDDIFTQLLKLSEDNANEP